MIVYWIKIPETQKETRCVIQKIKKIRKRCKDDFVFYLDKNQYFVFLVGARNVSQGERINLVNFFNLCSSKWTYVPVFLRYLTECNVMCSFFTFLKRFELAEKNLCTKKEWKKIIDFYAQLVNKSFDITNPYNKKTETIL